MQTPLQYMLRLDTWNVVLPSSRTLGIRADANRAWNTIITLLFLTESLRKEKKRKDDTFRRQFNEKPSIILGCPGTESLTAMHSHKLTRAAHVARHL